MYILVSVRASCSYRNRYIRDFFLPREKEKNNIYTMYEINLKKRKREKELMEKLS